MDSTLHIAYTRLSDKKPDTCMRVFGLLGLWVLEQETILHVMIFFSQMSLEFCCKRSKTDLRFRIFSRQDFSHLENGLIRSVYNTGDLHFPCLHIHKHGTVTMAIVIPSTVTSSTVHLQQFLVVFHTPYNKQIL